MFDFGNANTAQKLAVSSANGAVLITAGPGTGKTYTLVQRAIYLIQECDVKPEQILMATFTEKAAKEIITRITNELAVRNIYANVNEMYIGTFHSLCLRILKDNLEFTQFRKNYRLLDSFDQKYLVFRNIHKFRDIADIELIMPNGGAWKWAETICELVGTLTEELVDADAMAKDSKAEIRVLSAVVKQYHQLLTDENLIDFAKIQTECYYLLKNNPSILENLQEKIHYLMIDEYQDTNYIQEQIIFMLGEKYGNICVVGDDDQGLYRFRGATIRNILEFPHKFEKNSCKIIPLTVNYRSNSDIIDFYNEWMSTTEGAKFKFEWGNFRYSKHIVPHKHSDMSGKAVIRLASKEDEDEWHDKILAFIHKLKDSGKLTDYNQIAFLFSSVKSPQVTKLANFLESHGINVYSPRSDMFFKRNEIMLTLGCLMLMFPLYIQAFVKGEYKFLQTEHYNYYRDCIELANTLLCQEKNNELKKFIRSRGKSHAMLSQSQGSTDYAYSGLLYQLFAFKPFSTVLDTDLSSGVVDVRPARNLAMFSQIIGKFEYLHRINVFTDRFINKNTEILFNLYLRLLFDGGISEYEDDSEYAPSGCVSFMTIHQSKGMEFPIVLVDSLGNVPRKSYKDLMSEVEMKYYHRPQFEPYEQMKYFDFWRLYYTAFSRAQDLLVLTCNENNRTPSLYFRDIYAELPAMESSAFNLNEFDFHTVKAVNIKNTFSFTSHITVYETCSLQYKFYKELEFMPIRENAMMFGTLVHETIEDIHRAAIRQDEHLITPENVTDWFENNYISLVKSEHTYLAEPQKKAALRQVLRYMERQHGDWSLIRQAEVDVSLVQPDYIIEGKIDLIKGTDGSIEIVDFKSERKPDLEKARDKIEHYRRQLHIYAYLVEQRTGQKVSKMHLYYTGEENGSPIISFPYTKSAVDGTVASFDDTVHKIMQKQFSKQAESLNICKNCDFKHYCQNK